METPRSLTHAALDLDLAPVDGVAGAGRIRCVHAGQSLVGSPGLLLAVDVGVADSCALVFVEEELDAAGVHAGRRPVASLDPGDDLRDALGGDIGEPDHASVHRSPFVGLHRPYPGSPPSPPS